MEKQDSCDFQSLASTAIVDKHLEKVSKGPAKSGKASLRRILTASKFLPVVIVFAYRLEEYTVQVLEEIG